MSEKTQHIRKLAAIMFTDMVGYSAMTQRDESLALDLLEEHRTMLRLLFPEYGGREIETVGDAFFVEFSSALEAVRCAVEIQTLLHTRNDGVEAGRKIKLRIGIHLGDVVYRGPNMLGDGVNIAARLEPLAEPEGICISEDVARQVQNKIDIPIRKLDRKNLKNIQLPVDIYAVLFPWSVQPQENVQDSQTTGRWRLSAKHASLRWIAVTAFVALLGIVIYLIVPFRFEPSNSKTIAVLPFENMSSSADDNYFSEGMTDDLLTQLGKIAEFKVISPRNLMRYKGTMALREIGKELNAGAILEGKVRRAAGQVRISARLIDANTEEQIWTESYDKEFQHIFAIQSDVAKEIAHALRARLSPDEKERLDKMPTGNLAAYDLYLKGRYYWNMRLPDKLKIGIEHFQQAIAMDSDYALAYAGLADSYTILGNFNLLPPSQTYPKAMAAASKAIALDENLAEAHASLGFAIMSYDWDWVEAEKELRLAIVINPNYATARSWLAFLLTMTGRFDEATSIRNKALELDPYSPVINADVGLALYFSRKYDEAIEQFNRTLSIDPTFALAYVPLGGAYVQKRMYKEAIAEYQKFTAGLAFARLRHPIPLAALAQVYAISGRKEDAINMMELLDELSSDGQYVPPYWRGVVALGFGDKKQALFWLENAFEVHDGSMVFLKVDPVFDAIRSEPRFKSLLKKMAFG